MNQNLFKCLSKWDDGEFLQIIIKELEFYIRYRPEHAAGLCYWLRCQNVGVHIQAYSFIDDYEDETGRLTPYRTGEKDGYGPVREAYAIQLLADIKEYLKEYLK